MKITPEQLNQIRNQEQNQQTRTKKNQENFARLLDQEMGKSQESGKTPTKNTAENISTSAFLQVSLLNNNPSQSTVMENLDNILSKWEKYANQLKSPQASPKEMYAGLEEVSKSIKATKDSFDMQKQTSEIRDLLNELDVMAATEQIKFNRGDYLS